MKVNRIRTSPKVAKIASKKLSNHSLSQTTKTLAGSTLVNRKARVK